jgi:hypothetical protein
MSCVTIGAFIGRGIFVTVHVIFVVLIVREVPFLIGSERGTSIIFFTRDFAKEFAVEIVQLPLHVVIGSVLRVPGWGTHS